MSQDDKLYKQLEDFVVTIIKSLENLEKEFTEYIDVTNRRIQNLEEKVHRIDSLADVSGKGLLKAIESSPSPDNVKGLAHLTTPITEQPGKEAKATPQVESPIPKQKAKQPPSIVPRPPSEQKTDVQLPTTMPTSGVPPIPKPPSFKTTIAEEPTTPKLTESVTLEVQKPLADEKKPKKEDEDKDELMSALKIIDSL